MHYEGYIEGYAAGRKEAEGLVKALADVISCLPNPLAWRNDDMDKIQKAKRILSEWEKEELSK
jgi:hypothetical protein